MLRAADSGYGALVVTVDTVVAGNRVRVLRKGLTMPLSLSLGAVASLAAWPGYWWRLLAGPPLELASFTGQAGRRS